MLEEALPLGIAVGVALLPAAAFGGLMAARSFMILGGEDSGFFKALEEGKTEEEALAVAQGAGAAAAAPVVAHTPYEPSRPSFAAALAARPAAQGVVAHSVVERRAAGPSFGFAARFLQ